MTDAIVVTTQPTRVIPEIYKNPVRFFQNNLAGGELTFGSDKRHRKHKKNARIIAAPGEALVLHCRQESDGHYYATKYRANLQKLLFLHNGRVLSERYFIFGLHRLLQLLKQVFPSPEIAEGLVPGLTTDHRSWFSELEIMGQCRDSDWHLLNTFKTASHQCAKKIAMYNESITFGKRSSGKQICIYQKKEEMIEKYGADLVKSENDIIRFELRLKGEGLVEAFKKEGRGQIRMINGMKRLVAFAYDDLRLIHQKTMLQFQGVSPLEKLDYSGIHNTGKFIAALKHRSDDPWMTMGNMADLYTKHAGVSDKVRNDVLRGAKRMSEILNKSGFSLEELFSDDFYSNPPPVWVPKKERVAQAQNLQLGMPYMIRKAYGDIPYSPAFYFSQWKG